MFQNLPITRNFGLALKIEGPSQVFHISYRRLNIRIKLQQSKRIIKSWMSTSVKWDDLHRHIRSSRRFKYFGQLLSHHTTATDKPNEGGFIDQGPKVGGIRSLQ